MDKGIGAVGQNLFFQRLPKQVVDYPTDRRLQHLRALAT